MVKLTLCSLQTFTVNSCNMVVYCKPAFTFPSFYIVAQNIKGDKHLFGIYSKLVAVAL